MKTADELTHHLKKSLGEKLKAVVLYGSAASGDQTKKYSDQNVFVVVEDLHLKTLKLAMPAAQKWGKAGNPAPLFFTEKRIKQAEDVFPLEFLDIKRTHKLLYGSDPFQSLNVPTQHLRHQLEYELRGKLIQLRERYIQTGANPKAVQELLARSLSTFNVLFRGVIELMGLDVPPHREAVWMELKKHVNIDVDNLKVIDGLRQGFKSGDDPDKILEKYLVSIESVIDFVDKFNGGAK